MTMMHINMTLKGIKLETYKKYIVDIENNEEAKK